MYWPKMLVTILIFSLLTGLQSAHAEEEEPKAKSTKESNEAPAAEATAVDFSGHQTEEWMVVQTQLTTMKGKVENQKKLVESLIQQKEITKGAEQVEVIEELKKAHLEYVRVIESYNQLNNTFQTKFPEKGGTVGRVYKRIDPANIESMRKKMSAEGRLQKLNKTIETQYSKVLLPSDTNKSALTLNKKGKKNLMKPAAPAEKVQDIQVTDQIILQK